MGDVEPKPRLSLPTAWTFLTRGPESQPPAQQRRTRILLSLVISMMLLSIVAFAVLPSLVAATVNPADRYALGVVTPSLMAVFVVFMIIAYALGRTGRYFAAALLIVAVNIADSYAAMIATGNVFFLTTLCFSSLLAGILVSWRITLAVVLVTGALMATLPFTLPGTTMVGVIAYFLIDLTLGTFSLVSAATRDRDLKQIEEQTRKILADQEEILGARKMETVARLSAGVAHEFNNLMTSVMGYAELIQATGSESASGHAGFILEAGTRAARLTEHLLSFSRQQMLRLAPVSINALVTSRANAVHSPVTFDLAAESSTAMIDARLVGQAFDALLRRSFLRAGPGGAVTVGAFDERVQEKTATLVPGNYRVITLVDDGPPLQDDVFERVFDPFYTTGDFGTGEMDLAAAYGIITQSGGRLSFRREPAGGNCFTVYLPLTSPAEGRR